MNYIRRITTKWNLYFANDHLGVIARDLMSGVECPKNDHVHLNACLEWLVRITKQTNSKGVPFAYSFRLGFPPPYPETTGYIINTFIDQYHYSKDEKYLALATGLADWEIDIQHPSGAVRMQRPDSELVDVFDTGMVILGLTTIFTETRNEKYLMAARKAADWLVSIQDDDGKWVKYNYKDTPHAYHTKVAWSLFSVFIITNELKYKEACERNIKWALSLVQPNGWIADMSFGTGEHSFSHTVAYTLQGFIETCILMDSTNPLRKVILEAVINFCDKLIDTFRLDRETGDMLQLPGMISESWEKADDSACLTGNAQFAVVLYRLYKITDADKYYFSATTLLNIVKKTQILTGKITPYKNAIAGSYPVWGEYHPYEYPNWAAKFFADALLEKIKIDEFLDIWVD